MRCQCILLVSRTPKTGLTNIIHLLVACGKRQGNRASNATVLAAIFRSVFIDSTVCFSTSSLLFPRQPSLTKDGSLLLAEDSTEAHDSEGEGKRKMKEKEKKGVRYLTRCS